MNLIFKQFYSIHNISILLVQDVTGRGGQQAAIEIYELTNSP